MCIWDEIFEPISLRAAALEVVVDCLSHRADAEAIDLTKNLKGTVVNKYDNRLKEVTQALWECYFCQLVEDIKEAFSIWTKEKKIADAIRLIEEAKHFHIMCHWTKPKNTQMKLRACCHKCGPHFGEAFGYEVMHIEDRHFGLQEVENSENMGPKRTDYFCICCGVPLVNFCSIVGCNICEQN